MGNLGCENMKKRKIFDIEKVGFGDEVRVKPKVMSPPKVDKVKLVDSVIEDSIIEPTSTKSRPKVGVEKVEAKQPKITNVKIDAPESSRRAHFNQRNYQFKPVEFVSPITGRREKQPKVVQLAHGQYEFSTASLVETVEDSFEEFLNELDFDSDMEKYENQEMGTIECQLNDSVEESGELLKENVDSLLGEQEVERDICPCYSVQSNDDSMEENETEIAAGLSNETTLIQVSPIEEEIEQGIESIEVNSVPDLVTKAIEIEQDREVITIDDQEDFLESIESFQDENFCNEVLENVTIEKEESVFYYETPPLALLDEPDAEEVADEEWILNKMDILEQTFNDFGVKVRLTGDYTQGPTITQIEIQPESGTKVSKILGLYNDLKLNLSVEELRIEPIPGKNTIGVEIPNVKRRMVRLKEILSNPEFVLHESPLYIGLGQDIAGEAVYADILTMPHGLIAGQTGSGKSVCINTLLISILYKASPEDVRIMLIDPKRVELAPYNKIPHLVTPVIVDERKAAMGLKWAVEEMERRYELFAQNGVRDINSFNERRHDFELDYAKLPYILIVIDELADLMMVSAQEVEEYIMRITQKARAAGIHLIVATQRPTVDVITGTIKSNIPSRIAFAVAQGNDSRVILDEMGAQTLLGKGDMLLSQSGSKLKRVQGAFISADEIDTVVDFVKTQGKPKYLIEDQVFEKGSNGIKTDSDPLIKDAMRFFFDKGYATASSLQTRMAIGYNRAARIVDTLEMNGWIGQPHSSTKQREILITRDEFESLVDETRF